MKLVIIESPYAGAVKDNRRYARACMKDSLHKGESPLASHLLYTQPGILDDTIAEERNLGMEAGFSWMAKADLIAVYTDKELSSGMKKGIERAIEKGINIEFRSLQKPTKLNQTERK